MKRLRTAVVAIGRRGHLIGESPPMIEVYALLERVQSKLQSYGVI